MKAVAITGMGILSAAGQGIPAIREALWCGTSHFSTRVISPLNFQIVGAFIQEYSSQAILETIDYVSKNTKQNRSVYLHKMLKQIPKHIEMALIATHEAWQQAAIPESADRTQIGLIVSAQNSTTRYQYDSYLKFQEQPDYLSPYYALHFMDTDYIGYLSDFFGILGEGFTVGGASAGGNIALLRAYQLIQSGCQQWCVVVGAPANLSPVEFQGFYNIGALGGKHKYFIDHPNKASRPFDKASDGFIYGEASACLILESVESAIQRNIPILGYLLGGAILLDGNYLSNPSEVGEVNTMNQALKMSAIDVSEINYINTHGTSSPLGDKIELEALERVLGSHKENVRLNSTKSIVGHCLWSAGIVEAIATLIQIQDEFVHPNLNLENPINENWQWITGKSEKISIKKTFSNSFGFGGINSCIVLGSSLDN